MHRIVSTLQITTHMHAEYEFFSLNFQTDVKFRLMRVGNFTLFAT